MPSDFPTIKLDTSFRTSHLDIGVKPIQTHISNTFDTNAGKGLSLTNLRNYSLTTNGLHDLKLSGGNAGLAFKNTNSQTLSDRYRVAVTNTGNDGFSNPGLSQQSLNLNTKQLNLAREMTHKAGPQAVGGLSVEISKGSSQAIGDHVAGEWNFYTSIPGAVNEAWNNASLETVQKAAGIVLEAAFSSPLLRVINSIPNLGDAATSIKNGLYQAGNALVNNSAQSNSYLLTSLLLGTVGLSGKAKTADALINPKDTATKLEHSLGAINPNSMPSYTGSGIAGGGIMNRPLHSTQDFENSVGLPNSSQGGNRTNQTGTGENTISQKYNLQINSPQGHIPTNITLSDVRIDSRIDAGGHSTAYSLRDDPNSVAIILKNHDPRHSGTRSNVDPEVVAHLQSQVNYMGSIDLKYGGHSIAPEIKRVIVDDNGHMIGYVAEKIKGRDMAYMVSHGELKGDALANVLRQIEDQATILHQNGFIHGDLNMGNVLITGNPPVARLIDFEPPKSSYSVADEITQIGNLRTDARIFSSEEMVQKKLRANRQKAAQQEWFTFRDARETELTDIRRNVSAQKIALEDAASEELLDVISSIQRTLRLNDKAYQSVTPDDFVRAANTLAPDEQLMTQLRTLGQELPAGAKTALDDMTTYVQGIQTQWSNVPRFMD